MAPPVTSMARALAILKGMLEDPSVLKIGHNIKYDLQVFARYGIRLVPLVVFVQRIVRYLRDTNTQMIKLVRKRQLFTWYIKQAHSKQDANMLLQAWEQRMREPAVARQESVREPA